MRSARAVFVKQARDVLRNRMVLIQFILFPIMALILTELVAKSDDEIPATMFVTMFAAIFAGMTPLMATSTAIAEDREHKSLRFLVMAGVRPVEYLLGVGGFILLICSMVAVAFGLIGGFAGVELVRFVGVIILGCLASSLLGATVGIFSKNQQASTAMGTPIAMLLAFCPMLAMFNETISKVAGVLYTLQVDAVVSGTSDNLTHAFLIIAANIVVLAVLFVLAYRKKGLRS